MLNKKKATYDSPMELTLPNLSLPNLELPVLTLPELTLPELSLPECSLPNLKKSVVAKLPQAILTMN